MMTGLKIVFKDGVYTPSESSSFQNQLLIYPYTRDTNFDSLEYKAPYHKDFIFEQKDKVLKSCGAFIFINSNFDVDKPVHIVHQLNSSTKETYTKNFICLDKNIHIHFLEAFLGSGEKGHSKFETHIVASEKTYISFNQIQGLNLPSHFTVNEKLESHPGKLTNTDQTHHLYNQISAQLETSSELHLHLLTRTHGQIKNKLNIQHKGPDAKSHIKSTYYVHSNYSCENHVQMNHLFEHGESSQLFKGILLDRSHGLFKGKIFIDQNAQKVQSQQTHHNLVLSDRAQATSLPQLEVLADDVKAQHGATVGGFDEEQLFYLMSRGLIKQKALELMAFGYASETLQDIKNESIRKIFFNFLNETQKEILESEFHARP